MRDSFGRDITYLRLSLTDRCDLRCTYCMPARMAFLPKADILTLEELDRVASCFIRHGIRKLRLTGGEPLVRKGATDLVTALGRHVRTGALDELTLTTNGSQLAAHAGALAAAGVRRINVSLDHLDTASFSRITRGGDLRKTMDGIAAASAAGIAVKINTVVLRDGNLEHLPELVAWAHGQGFAVTLIEVMPMGDVGIDRLGQHVPMPEARRRLEARWPLADVAMRTGGPARYARTAAGALVGFITPLSNMFCDECNRLRVSADGKLHACLGREVAVDLRPTLREHADDGALELAIAGLVRAKPRSHDFRIAPNSAPAVARTMSATGG
ncbi:MAG TPA: GTP 3',8-cyclase MoaA [Sphingomicrobium sp.]|nr:GTP 3',8-cyclase MoaA [Sphingomicrobium sp.]